MHFVHPADIERFALRTLLLYKKGAKSFRDFMTHDSITFGSFMATVKKMGLIESDGQWERTMEEAVQTITNINELRGFFTNILVNCQPQIMVNCGTSSNKIYTKI